MSLPRISPAKAKDLLDQGAILIDIRETDEHAREKVIGARHLPLSKLDEADLVLHAGKPVIFHCKSGARTMNNASRLAQKDHCRDEIAALKGGVTDLLEKLLFRINSQDGFVRRAQRGEHFEEAGRVLPGFDGENRAGWNGLRRHSVSLRNGGAPARKR